MYRDPSRGPCIATILPTFLGFGGIQHTILSYNNDIGATFVGASVATQLVMDEVHGLKNAL